METNNTGRKDFNRKTVNALGRKGIALIGTTFVPGVDGTFANGERAYLLNDNGTQLVRSYLDVVAMAVRS